MPPTPSEDQASISGVPGRHPLHRQALAAEMEGWVRDGLLSQDQATRILARYPGDGDQDGTRLGSPPGFRPATHGTVASILYGVAAVLLGAAGLTFVLVLSPRVDPDPFHFFLLGAGLGLLGFGLRAWGKSQGAEPAGPDRARGFARAPRFPDALWQTVMTGALLPLSAASVAAADDPTALPFAGVGLAAALGVLWGLRHARFTSPIAVVCAAVVVAAAVSSALGPGDLRAWATAGAHLLLVGATIRLLGGPGAGRRLTAGGETVPAHPVSVALAVGAFAISLWASVNRVVGMGDAEWSLLVVGAVMAGGAMLGLRMGQQGLVLGSGVALAICGIGFAFTVGGFLVGTGVLTATALLLIWKAGSLLTR